MQSGAVKPAQALPLPAAYNGKMNKRLPRFMLVALVTLAPAAPCLRAADMAHAQTQAQARMQAQAPALSRHAACQQAMRQQTLAQQAILRSVAQLAPAHPLRRRYRLAIPFGDPLFPPDDTLRTAPGQPQDPALEAWLRLPRSARAHDVLVMPDSDYYWNQEGRDYSAQFIVHLVAGATGCAAALGTAPDAASSQDNPAGVAGNAGSAGIADGTGRMQVLQVHATHRLGRRFRLLGRTGPGHYWELHPAPTSARAAADLAAFLASPPAALLEGQQR